MLVGISSSNFYRRRDELWSTNKKIISRIGPIDTPEVLVHCKVAAIMNFAQMQTKDACMIANKFYEL